MMEANYETRQVKIIGWANLKLQFKTSFTYHFSCSHSKTYPWWLADPDNWSKKGLPLHL